MEANKKQQNSFDNKHTDWNCNSAHKIQSTDNWFFLRFEIQFYFRNRKKTTKSIDLQRTRSNK